MPRPDLGDLVPAFDNAATLYGGTLTVTAEAGDNRADHQWSEHVYTADENPERWRIQQREWRIGRGEATDADFDADMREGRMRRYIEARGQPER